MLLFSLLLTSLWAAPNMADPQMREQSTEAGQVPCLTDCGRPTPTYKLLDATNGRTDSKQDTDDGSL